MDKTESPNKKERIGIVELDVGELEIRLSKGECLYVLGPNGAGKSTLLYTLAENIKSKVLITGNREIIFSSSSISISAEQAKKYEGYRQSETTLSKRADKSFHNNSERLSTTLFHIKSKCDDINRLYRQTHMSGEIGKLESINENEPIQLINKALHRSGMALSLDWDDKSALNVTKDGYVYGVQHMSDGERAALILTCEVILSENDSVILIDEPERHLHRSISSPLLQYLRSIRPDLKWIIATHDLTLPKDESESSALIVYKFLGNKKWKAELIENREPIPPNIIEAIYGARQKVIFIEGKKESRDAPLYGQLFKGVTVIPAGNCRDVCEAVSALNKMEEIHLIEGRGIVDGDNRDDANKLKKKGVYPLDIYAIESIYYHSTVIDQMIKHSAEDVTASTVVKDALKNLGKSDHLAKITAYRKYREKYMREMLDDETFAISKKASVEVDGPKLIAEAQEHLEKLKQKGDWTEITKLYKIKSTGAPKAIANKLGYSGCAQYERALVKALDKDVELLKAVRELVPDPFSLELKLDEAIENGPVQNIQ